MREHEAKLDKISNALSKLAKHVDFSALAAKIDETAPQPERECCGRPRYTSSSNTTPSVKVVDAYKQHDSLSDEQMGFQFLDRVSFQRFVVLRPSLQIPDRMTIWAFKERLIKAMRPSAFLKRSSNNSTGDIARGGQIIDASIVSVPVQRASRKPPVAS